MKLEDVLKSEEIVETLEAFSKSLEISVWLSDPQIEEVNKISPVWGEKPGKKELTRAGMLKAECKPGRIEMRRKAVAQRKPIIELCPLQLYVFTAPIFIGDELIGFFEGDGAKARPMDEEWRKIVQEKQKKYGFDIKLIEECVGEKTRIKSKEELAGMIDVVVSSIKLYLELMKKQEEFIKHLIEISRDITKTAKNIQTLGINAAIESARLGEKGAGFAVVASEIKKVGDLVSQQAKRLKEHIDELML
ncbi:MAG: PocR ligand-binding domain-containing protein [Synergistetes bacterium]|nr:PocR ligand-binding domain-containing protein [Synergistota bacterium]